MSVLISAYMSIFCDTSFKLIKDVSGTDYGQTWAVKAYESPDEIKIYVKNLYGLFDPEGELRSWGKQLSFRVSIEGKAIQVVYDKEKNPKEGGYGPAGGFRLPIQMAQELWPMQDAKGCFDSRFIDPIKLSDDEIILSIPKYKSGSYLYDWWHQRQFSVWTMPLD